MDISQADLNTIFIIIGFMLNTIGIIRHNINTNRIAVKGVLTAATATVHEKGFFRMDLFNEEFAAQRMCIWIIILGSIMMALGGILIVF